MRSKQANPSPSSLPFALVCYGLFSQKGMIPTPSQQKKAMGPIHNLSAQTALDPNIMFYIKDIFTRRIKTYFKMHKMA